MTDFTPGPWHLDRLASTHIVAENGRGIASTGVYSTNTDNGEHIEENDANARLIAAAPDLLAALESMFAEHFTFYPARWDGDLGYHIGPGVCYGEACECGGEQAARAIAKARGQEMKA